ncbi:MAG: ribonuclease [Rhizobiaceae bacterium]|nr:ribonuclease [Rhizobiaceae bacterium]
MNASATAGQRRRLSALAGLLALGLAGCTDAPGDGGAQAVQPPSQPPSASLPEAKTPVAASGTGFDFYVLALSWSPSFCAEEGLDAPNLQCGTDRDFAFVVHGLWPQFERGWPEFCASREPQRVPEALARRLRDIMPSTGLVGGQWRKHGTCTGLSQEDFVTAIREAWDAVEIPSKYRTAVKTSQMDPDDIEAEFRAANPGMPAAGIAVSCRDRRLDEVRICLTKELGFRACPEIDERACRAASVQVPAAP